MKGKLTRYSAESRTGSVRGEDGREYTFQRDDWGSQGEPIAGESAVFELESGRAISVYRWGGTMHGVWPKNRIAAALFAFFLGWLGAHKFYIGRNGVGFIHLLPIAMYVTALAFVLLFTTAVDSLVPLITIYLSILAGFLLSIISLIEAILYITKTDEEFQRDYVYGQRAWF